MVTENVDIRFRESGGRVVQRTIDGIGESANRATRGIFLLQRALFVIGGAGILRGLQRQADLLTNIENRLRITSSSTANLEAVQRRLFETANRSRSSFESVAEIYSRTALSVRALGVSQQETIQFTESLAKASIISGASTREANAALIQLSQGLASNRLSGDELRSVLEQLPFVADVIANQLGITRGELRQFGRDGKISAEVVLDAFRNARDEIDRLFDQTTPTISQAFTVASNNLLSFIDRIDDATNISGRLAQGIITISENFDILAASIGVVGIALTATLAGRGLSALGVFIARLRTGAVASARFAEVEQLRAQGAVRRAAAQRAASVADLAAINQGRVQLAQNLQILQAQRSRELVIFNVARAQAALSGSTTNLTLATANLNRTTAALIRTRQAQRATDLQLTATGASLTASTNALAAANTRLAGATAASSGLLTRFTRAFPTLSGVIGSVVGVLSRFIGLLAANPFTALIVGIGSAALAIFGFGNQLKVTEDGVVGFRDFTVAAFQLIGEAVQPLTTTVRNGFQVILDISGEVGTAISSTFSTVFDGVIGFARDFVNTTVALFRTLYRGIVEQFDQLPQALRQAGITAVNALIAAVEGGLNLIQRNVASFFQFIGSAAELVGRDNPFENLVTKPFDLGRLQDQGTEAAESVLRGFSGILQEELQRDFVGEALGSVTNTVNSAIEATIARARENIAARAAGQTSDLITTGDRTGTNPAASSNRNRRTFGGELERIAQRTQALRLESREREIYNGILQIERAIKRDLTSAETAQADAALRSLQIAQDQARLLDQINGPQQRLNVQLQTASDLYEQGSITSGQFANQLRQIAVAQAQLNVSLGEGTFADGFLIQLDRMTQGVQSFQAGAGQAFGSFFSTVADGFATTVGNAVFQTNDLGEAFKRVARQGISSLITALVKLGIQYLANQAIGLTVQATSAAAGVAQAAAISAAFAPAAALVSLATSGANATGAAAGIASIQALTSSLGAVGGVGFRDGGFVQGAGTGRSDSILAPRLSNGEFVVNARATQRNRQTLENINAGGDGGRSITIGSITISTPNVDSFVENEALIVSQMQEMIELAEARGDVT